MPTAQITISANQVSFRLKASSHDQFNHCLDSLKHQLPSMRWNPVDKTWQLPVDELQTVYETCRALVGPDKVHLSTNYKASVPVVQPSLFD